MPRLLPALLIAASLFLAGCDSAEERAEKHFQSALVLIEKGDIDRGLVELRNVFQLNGQHLQARLTYARIQRDRGILPEAYSQYLLLAEQYPDNVEARLALSEMAISRNDWEEAQRHGTALVKLAPDDPMAQMIGTMLEYRAAALAKDRGAGAAPAAKAEALMAAHADNPTLVLMAYRVLIDRAVTGVVPEQALPVLDKALALDPHQFEWQMLKLRLLLTAGDQAAIGAHLHQMYDLFPQDTKVRDLLIAWYMDQKDVAGAEAFLRRLAEDAATSGAEDAAKAAVRARLNVVQFLKQIKGAEAAVAELDTLLAADPGNPVYSATRAALEFELGNKDDAIAALEGLLKDAPDSEDIRNVKVALARMLGATGDNVGARARIEEVLASDPSHVAALKMKAAWLIDEDKPGDAIIALRTALDQAPRDAEVLTLMGQAHERDGARDLAGERYGLAVEVSGRAVPESVRYARFLMADKRLDSALSVLDDSLSVNPRSAPLLATRADLLIEQRDWQNATDTVVKLRALGTPEAIAAANKLDATLLLKQEKVDETIAFLDGLTKGADTDRSAVAAVVQTQIKAGKMDAARDYLDGLLAKTPEDPALRFLRAGLYVLNDQPAEAEAIYRALMAEAPDNMRPFQALYKLMLAGDRGDEAKALLDGALQKDPESMALNLIKAAALERAEDFEGAIAIYEKLYARDSNSLILANNLASMITSHRDDAASVERAFAIAHRLRGSDVPALQDTYGWIEYRRGNFDEALANLEPAALGLPKDPMVQVHLGLTYAALKRNDEARAKLAAALEMAGEAAKDGGLPQYDAARKVLADLGGPP